MSEKPYMQQLYRWTEETILEPIHGAWSAYVSAESSEEEKAAKQRLTEAEMQVRKAVREKVLESYRNGQQAGPARPKAGPARRQYKPRQ